MCVIWEVTNGELEPEQKYRALDPQLEKLSYSRCHSDSRGYTEKMVFDSLGIVHIHTLEALTYKTLCNHLNSNTRVRCLSFHSPCNCAFNFLSSNKIYNESHS